MKDVTLESQLKALYDKAHDKKRLNEKSESSFSDTLKSTIERMNAISDTADDAIKTLESAKPGDVQKQIDQAGSIHKRLMEEQNNLAALYEKLKLSEDSES